MILPYFLPGDALSTLYKVFINGINVPVAQFPGLTPEESNQLADRYHKMPAHCWVAAREMTGHFAHAACDGEAQVEILLPDEGMNPTIFPSRRGIQVYSEGRWMRFKVPFDEPRYLIVDFGDRPLLCILIDPPEPQHISSEDADVVNITQFFAADTLMDPTIGFDRGLRMVNGTGKTLYVPAGTYTLGTILMREMHDFNIYLAPGALLRTRTSPPGQNLHLHGIWMDQCSNIRIFGRGCLDHQGFENFKDNRNNYMHGLVSWAVPNPECPYTSQSPLFVTASKDITIEGITFRNARNFNVNLRRSDRVTLRHCKVITPPGCVPEFTDGYQINACHDTLLENCFAFCNDDCVASGHYFYSYDDCASDNLTVRGFVGWNPRANALRLGFYTHYDMGNFTFENCDFTGMIVSGIQIHALKDAPEAGRYQTYGKIRFKNCSFDRTDRLISGLIMVEGARIANLELEDVSFDSPSQAPSLVSGSEDAPIQEFNLKRVSISGKTVKSLNEANIQAKHVREINF